MMCPRLIQTEADYKMALQRIEELWDAKPGTSEGDNLDILVRAVEKYEDERYPIPPPDPITAIRFRMEQQGLKQQDLVPFFGGKNRVSEVLNGKRPLTLDMIRKLHEGLGIPAEVLLQNVSSPSDPESEAWLQNFREKSEREKVADQREITQEEFERALGRKVFSVTGAEDIPAKGVNDTLPRESKKSLPRGLDRLIPSSTGEAPVIARQADGKLKIFSVSKTEKSPCFLPDPHGYGGVKQGEFMYSWAGGN